MAVNDTLLFLVFPYVMLTLFAAGSLYRYRTDRFGWTARSSEFLEKEELGYGAALFHWGVILTLFGHAGGLLIPQDFYDRIGIDSATHLEMAYYAGLAVGNLAFIGACLLLFRRVRRARVRAVTSANDYVTLAALVLVTGAGLYNVLFGHFDVLDTVAPWIRGILTFSPRPELMRTVPLSYRIHILSALALVGFSPFSRLVHVWSAPLTYFFRGHILYRRHVPE